MKLNRYLAIPFSFKDVLEKDNLRFSYTQPSVFSAIFFCNCGVRSIHLRVGSIAKFTLAEPAEREKDSFVSR